MFDKLGLSPYSLDMNPFAGLLTVVVAPMLAMAVILTIFHAIYS